MSDIDSKHNATPDQINHEILEQLRGNIKPKLFNAETSITVIQHGPDRHEPPPVRNNEPAMWDIVRQDMLARDNFGRAKHGVPLQPFNSRDSLWDAYQELLDLVVYLRTVIYEREHPKTGVVEEYPDYESRQPDFSENDE